MLCPEAVHHPVYFFDVKNEMSKSQNSSQQNPDTKPQTSTGGSELDIECGELNDTDAIFSNINKFVDEILAKSETDEAKSAVLEFVEAASTTAITEYSFRNQMILYLQLKARDPEYRNNAHHFTGYKTWQTEHNRHVKEGESGYNILAPRIGHICPECGNTPNYHTNGWIDCKRAGTDPSAWDINPTEAWSEGVYMFRKTTTFAYQQTKPLDDVPEEEVFQPLDERETLPDINKDIEKVETLIETILEASENASFSTLDEPINATIGDAGTYTELITNGVSKNGEIHVTKQDDSKKVLRTLIHEIAHEINHHKEDQNLPKKVKEVEAELIAYVVCRSFGFTPPTSDLYIASWVEHANNKKTESSPNDTNTAPDSNGSDGQETARDIIKGRLDSVQSTASDIITTVRTER